MLNKTQKLFVLLWLVFAIYAMVDALYHIFLIGDIKKGLMFMAASLFAYFMHRVRKKQYQSHDN